MKDKELGVGLIVLFCISFIPVEAGAMSAEVLPKGVYRIGFDAAYKKATDYFTNDWGTNKESIVDDYNGIEVDASIFIPGLPPTLVDMFSLGTTRFELDNWAVKYQFSLFYGVTDRLSVGLVVPFSRGEYTADFGLDDCKVALNPYYDPNSFSPLLDQLPVLPIQVDGLLGILIDRYLPNRQPLDFDDINTFFTDPRFGFEYDDLPTPGTNVESGINDTLIGIRYLFHKSEKWRMAGSIWSMIPTGKFTDQDEVYSLKFGDGQLDVGFLWSIDYMPFGGRTFGKIFESLYLDLSFGYTFQLPDERKMRIWSLITDENGKTVGVLPIASKDSLVTVKRDYGDTIDAYFSGAVAFWRNFSFGYEFYGYWEFSDDYSGPNPWSPDNPDGHQYEAMEWQTERSAIDMALYLSFSTIPWLIEGSFPVPFDIMIGYGRSIAGKNIDVVTSWTLSFATYFSFDIFKGGMEGDLPSLKEVPKVSK